ncbi:hypothetical protein GDO81_007587 [Engystomops pustulosus]|nr:hypothetical protein GDO81_007587 [Engystomops pustulosus]KAG8581205.1 hypothetical protein GDO81_007587 [Engystomops pustulosus]KAG8581206.1 hypothetical protein GDO81_007587 [Engystomops pustulosus]KAG8581207.1 hypothetical protein GDO81_007587 [Engystomops pustulosus]KAG8581208.1 hypothetical protein GDO81_007587 [Engystomops pustulosus]
MYDHLTFIDAAVADNTSGLDTMDGHELLLADLQSLEPSCILLFIMTGKVLLNILIFGARCRNVGASLMACCCLSLAVVDLLLLCAISTIHYFQDFTILGFRVTSHHICLFTQITSHTYGILHLPFFLASGLDYYLTIVKSIHISYGWSALLYTACVVLLWAGAFAYVLLSPAELPEVDPEQSSYLCSFYISSQAFYLSLCIVGSIVFGLVLCCSEMVAFLKSLKVISFAENTVVLFSLTPGDKWPIQGGKHLLAALLFTFLGSWVPFVVLQVIILVLSAPIPAYMDMNVPWLYFMNSFLLGVSLGLKYPDFQVSEKTLSRDPFVAWKYCVLPFMYSEQIMDTSLLKEPLSPVRIV